ncbi:bifunctional aspartate kinase/diaminopimelate decarboxylase [Coralloluteibacterium stylophorae]|uniref:Diaminopimelate decarboxylase n=1 Tax=Coralloluteibacterium stylophorae TaxID=1776034 RepID=A0A8J7VS72_9GAMM|nr:bifunctional aspartate kinase/diaminopimelate decarboxylase [Coralloluteibacterium stylophorae]MBS7456700.1 bifunctional aspartate kinase/diaminopimelate decarboxylase [Coralloluteibacterium stylophorae]
MPAAAPAPWIVLKFGGTSVSKRSRWDTIGRLMRETAGRDGARVLTVVSALSGVTNALQALIDGHADAGATAAAAEALVERHERFCADELGLDPQAVLGARMQALRALAADPRRAAAALDWQAEVLAQGELCSSTLGAAYLRAQGLDIGWTDARDWLRTVSIPNQGEWARRLSVSCSTASDDALRARFAAQPHALLLSQGFIARADDGGTAILGRGGSDTSAAYFGALVGARRVEIWTDVPGMFSANPRQVPDARLLTRLDYEEAQEIATTGAKVLHPRCIQPCRDAGVPLWIRDTDRPELPGTEICGSAAPVPGVKALSSRRGIVLVSMESIGMWQQVGFTADVFERFKRHGLSIDLIGTSQTNITVSLDPSENLVSSNVLEALCADLAHVCRVKVIAPCAAITLVGRGIRGLLHRLTEVWSEFGRERVHLISQSSNDLNLTFVVDEELADGIMPRLHGLLIASGAMPVDETAVFGPSWRRLGLPEGARREAWWMARRDDLLDRAAAGTPRYVYDLDTVRARARGLAGIAAVDRRFFAIKANPHPAILRVLAEEGSGLECVSAGELAHVFAVLPDLDPGRVLFTPSFAPRAEYADALARGVHVTVDSVAPLRDWPELFAGREITLRIDPGFGSGHHEKVRTGGKGAKFGLAVDAVPAVVAAAAAAGARIVGLHAHIGSGIHDTAHWREVHAVLASTADEIGTVAFLDIGGGLGIAYDPDAEAFDLAAYARELVEMKAARPEYALWIEPGRWLVAEAGVLLLTATQVVDKQGVRRVGADAGMNALLRPALYGAFHEIVNLSRLDAPPGTPVDVVGPICESGDVLGRRRRLPDATREGDVLLVADAGAYGMVMANTYNQRALPVEEALA